MEIAIVLMALLICISVIAIKFNQDRIEFPFSVKSQLFTAAERQFLSLIEASVAGEFRVMCRIRLSDLLSLRKDTNGKIAKSALMRAGAKQVDFVLCNKDDMTPIMAIDLVYGTGKNGHNTQRDFFVSGALETASIPHIRIKAKTGYTVAEIRECIEAKLVPLRRRQGKIPFAAHEQRPSLIKTSSRPTRPLKAARNMPNTHAAA
ncbi:MAG: DUF2726 domain-containing protein [Glaciecola sp.]